MINQTKCPACDSAKTEVFLNRKNVPVHQNLLCTDKNLAVNTPRGNIELVVCLYCQFIFNRAFDLEKLSYGKDYDNTQTCSNFFSEYTDDLINKIISSQKITGASIVEVGCGKGLFIQKLISRVSDDNTGYGFDPSYVGPTELLGGRLKFEKIYYGPECAAIKADIVICRHVIEHVPDPLQLVSTIKAALVNSDQVRIFFETPCIEWIINHQVIFDIFYEHCSYFSAYSLKNIFERAGFNIIKVEKVFGEQYLWLEATLNQGSLSDVTPTKKKEPIKLAEFSAALDKFREQENKFIYFWQTKLKAFKKNNIAVAVWGAGAKGVTFANLIDPENKLISAFIDLNPKKQGNFIVGSGHPIYDYQVIGKNNIKTIIVMNGNYLNEIRDLFGENENEVELIDLLAYEINQKIN